MGSLAILVKARVQKGFVVESVYDIFDARIEQSLTQALKSPQQLRLIEAKGFPVPGTVRAVQFDGIRTGGSEPLAPALQGLLNAPS